MENFFVISTDEALANKIGEPLKGSGHQASVIVVAEDQFLEAIQNIDSPGHVVFCSNTKSIRDILYPPKDVLRKHLEGLGLTSKQVQILMMLTQGESNKAIAHSMHISEQGVKYHVGILLKKFQKLNRRDLQKYLCGFTANL